MKAESPEPCWTLSTKIPSFTSPISSSLLLLPGRMKVVVIRTIGSYGKPTARAFPVGSSPRAAAVATLCNRPVRIPFRTR